MIIRMFKRVVFLLVLFLIIVPIVKAQDVSNIDQLGIKKADHVASGFEKIQERISLFFHFTPSSKMDSYESLADKRLSELAYAVTSNDNLVEPTASRYATYISGAAEYAVGKGVSKDRKDKFVTHLDGHKKVISELQKKYKHDSGWWLAIQHDLNTIDIVGSKLK